jgi:hypothetical protein
MKAIETTFNTIAIALVIVVATLGALFFTHAGEVKMYEKSAINNVAVPLHAMIDGKQHHMFENPNVILDISYNK